MQYKKTIFSLLMVVFITSSVFSQTVDLVKAKQLEQKLVEFNATLRSYNEQLNNNTNLRTVKKIGVILKERSDALLKEVKQVYAVDDEYWLDAALDNAIANDIAKVAPNTANVLRTRATVKIIEGAEKEEQARPEYFKALKDIKNLSYKLSNVISLKRATQLTEKIKTEYNKLAAITT